MNSKELENWADRLIIEYEEGRSELNNMRDILNPEVMEEKEDRKHINSMINSMSFSIDWMKTGRRPGNMRGIDRRSAYQRRALLDMDMFPSLELDTEERVLQESEKQALIEILTDLSHRERQCFLLYYYNSMSMREIADELGIKKPSVQKFIERAKNKVKAKVPCHTNVI